MNLSKKINEYTSLNPIKVSYEEMKSKLVQDIKNICKEHTTDSIFISEIIRYLILDTTTRRNLHERINAIELIDVLFQRSKLFRMQFVGNNTKCNDSSLTNHYSISPLRKLLIAAGFIDTFDHQSHLKNKADQTKFSEFIKVFLFQWDNLYGSYLPELHASARYLRESLKLTDENSDRILLQNSIIRQNQSNFNSKIKLFDEILGNMEYHKNKGKLYQLKYWISVLEKCSNLLLKHNDLILNNQIQSQQNKLSSFLFKDKVIDIDSSKRLKSLDLFLANLNKSSEMTESNLFQNNVKRQKIAKDSFLDDNVEISLDNPSQDNIEWEDADVNNESEKTINITQEIENLDIETLMKVMQDMKIFIHQNYESNLHSWQEKLSDLMSFFRNQEIQVQNSLIIQKIKRVCLEVSEINRKFHELMSANLV